MNRIVEINFISLSKYFENEILLVYIFIVRYNDVLFMHIFILWWPKRLLHKNSLLYVALNIWLALLQNSLWCILHKVWVWACLLIANYVLFANFSFWHVYLWMWKIMSFYIHTRSFYAKFFVYENVTCFHKRIFSLICFMF